MKKTLCIAACACMILTGCTSAAESTFSVEISEVTSYIQNIEQLTTEGKNGYVPLNFEEQKAMWFPYIHYDEYMRGRNAEEFRSAVRELYSSAKAQSVNTLYLHVHPMGDAYYRSDIFPKGEALDGEYDPFLIMLEEAHSLGLSVHAWINPLRCQSAEQMEKLPDDFIIKQWTRIPGESIVKNVNGRWYLDPSHAETTELIVSCVNELLTRYDIDGVHIDDYFYPTTDAEFDRIEFEKSGAADLGEWRTENCTRFVRAIYDTVKSHDERLLFGISPQGNISSDYTAQYADVRLWGGTKGYCDYIVPQIYFGFRNESCPFERTLAEWESLVCDDVALVIGLGAYKLGKPDKWAGASGESEWIDDPNVIEKQKSLVGSSSAKGYALYF